MANTYLTDDHITTHALAVLHRKLRFIPTINRQYDEEFGRKGGKIGDSLRIRMPIDPMVVDGATMPDDPGPDLTETSQVLTLSTRKHVPMYFTMQDLALKIDLFSERYIEPAMSKLAASVEADVISRLTKEVPNVVGAAGTALNALSVPLAAKMRMGQYSAPDGDRRIILSDKQSVDIVDALKGLFNDQTRVGDQYEDGKMTRAAGFDWYESGHVATTTAGTRTNGTVTSTVAVNGASTISLSGLGASGTIKQGDTFTIAGVYAIEPETKAVRGRLQEFVVTADTTANGSGVAAAVPISPSLYYANATLQNISAAPQAAAVVTWTVAAGVAAENALAYHKNAFAFVTGDLPLPQGTDMASRKTFEGISLRMVRDYNVKTDTMAARIDILYGCKTLRPLQAVRMLSLP